MKRQFTQRRFVTTLTVTILAVYAVITTGAVMTTTRLGTSCTTWPLCLDAGGALLSLEGALVVGHRLLSLVAGLLVLATLIMAWQTETTRRVRIAVAVAGVAFPVQVGVGALVVTTEIAYVTELHLAIAAFIFVAFLIALGWTLETDTQDVGASALTDVAATPLRGETPKSTSSEPVSTENGDISSEPVSAKSADSASYELPPEAMSDTTHRASTRFRNQALAYLELTKPRLMWLLCLLALAGIALAATTGTWPTGLTIVATLTGGVLAVGASGTFNHVFEWDRDQRMERTADRPVATAQIPRARAALFGMALLALSMLVLATFVNTLATLLTLVAVGYYSILYTVVLKPNTSWNIALGGGAGALPAVIGWVAVTGSIGMPALVLAALVVVWTPAHFYNLAIVYREDYARGGYPMFPVVSGVAAARRRIILMLGVTLLTTTALVLVAPLGWLFALAAILAGALFLSSAVTQCRVRTDRATMRTFYTSNAYLGVVLLAIVAEALL
ncbi:heme o synthase [Halobacteria archaeon AArc-curdl1]|uniref:Protoheme IX farnesyltransferase n=1 Tax=Natronosalvus hydrolyticus TaxID=2979988 RepID=A0AAP3E7R5_9EURY|nr:heme o synthase [Halobacteria archaeon AArc-curdl1]